MSMGKKCYFKDISMEPYFKGRVVMVKVVELSLHVKKDLKGKIKWPILEFNSKCRRPGIQKSVLFISPFAKLRLLRNYICCHYFFFLVSLADIDECSASKPVCATNATGCQNTVGSFSCSCEAGFGGRYCNG